MQRRPIGVHASRPGMCERGPHQQGSKAQYLIGWRPPTEIAVLGRQPGRWILALQLSYSSTNYCNINCTVLDDLSLSLSFSFSLIFSLSTYKTIDPSISIICTHTSSISFFSLSRGLDQCSARETVNTCICIHALTCTYM